MTGVHGQPWLKSEGLKSFQSLICKKKCGCSVLPVADDANGDPHFFICFPLFLPFGKIYCKVVCPCKRPVKRSVAGGYLEVFFQVNIDWGGRFSFVFFFSTNSGQNIFVIGNKNTRFVYNIQANEISKRFPTSDLRFGEFCQLKYFWVWELRCPITVLSRIRLLFTKYCWNGRWHNEWFHKKGNKFGFFFKVRDSEIIRWRS